MVTFPSVPSGVARGSEGGKGRWSVVTFPWSPPVGGGAGVGARWFSPNSIKDLKAANPSAGIELIEPPQGNSQGTARVAYPVRTPQGRGAYEPDVRLVYGSNAPNGWLGVGWDLPLSKVEVDTRFGAPFYDAEERYLLDGEAIVPVGKVEGSLQHC